MRYTGNRLKEIRFPVGGIGTGSVSVCGNGLLRDFEIFGRPSKGSAWGFTHFAVRVETASGKVYTRVVCGDETENLSGAFSIAFSHSHGYGYGLPSASMNGFPHFREVIFDGEYPVCTLTFSDQGFPGKVIMTAWNPLIPQDSFHSSLPGAVFHLQYINETNEDVKVLFTFAVGCPFPQSVNTAYRADGLSALHIKSTLPPDALSYGDVTVMTDGDAFIQRAWYRGTWCDGIVTYMNELAAGDFRDRSYDDPAPDHGTLVKYLHAAKGGTADTDFVFTWNVPNAYNYWSPMKDESGKDVTWKHWYATQFADSLASAAYLTKNRKNLWEKTAAYRDAMFSQTLPEEVIDAAANTLSVLRSSTVMRLENGEFYGFEGTGPNSGSCEGTCTHVWSYAYAMCFLFPDLERSIRDLEYKYQTDENGLMDFRLKLPLGRRDANAFPCIDGQMGSVIRTFREWKISGDDDWLRGHWEDVKKVLSFAWSDKNACRWDADGDGVADGRMHHTLDVELFGAHAWPEGMYLAALKAAEKMADYLGDTAARDDYAAKFANGTRFMKENLFNGRYFVQKVDLTDVGMLESYICHPNVPADGSCRGFYWNDETNQIKYQIGDGCEIDQLLGLWHGAIVGIDGIFDETQAKTAAKSLYDNNFKTSMRDHVNPWRLFAINDEPGAVICTYPEGSTQPAIPIPYCQECMNGFEYSLAGTLIALGLIDEGLNIVKGVRSKYAGYNRNPYNEIECGSNYARSMASFALIPLLSGFTFDMPHETIGFKPKLTGDFRAFFSVGNAWGRFEMTNEGASVTTEAGQLTLTSISLPLEGKTVRDLRVNGIALPFTVQNGVISFGRTTVTSTLSVTFA